MKRLYFSLASLQVKKQEAPSAPEAKAIADIEKSGGSARPLAQNDDRLDVSFQMQGASVTDKDLKPIAQLKKIAAVNLAKTSVTDAGLAQLAQHPEIVQLHLEQTKITDAGLAQLKPLKNLEYLNLYGTAVTDAGIKQLAGLTNLKNLYLWQTKVTPEGAKKLKQDLPKLDINMGWEPEPAVPAKKEPESAKK
jgi:hypothetical protein